MRCNRTLQRPHPLNNFLLYPDGTCTVHSGVWFSQWEWYSQRTDLHLL